MDPPAPRSLGEMFIKNSIFIEIGTLEDRLVRWLDKIQDRFFFLFLLFLSVLVRALFPLVGYDLTRDGIYYVKLLNDWVTAGIVPTHRLCILPLVFGKLLCQTGVNSQMALFLVSFVFGNLVPIVFFLIGREFFKHNFPALAAGLFAVFHPVLVTFSVQPLREMSYLFFIGLLILLMTKIWEKNRWFLHGFSGMILAAASLSRYESLEWFIFYSFYLLFLKWKRKLSWEGLFLGEVLFIISFLGFGILLGMMIHSPGELFQLFYSKGQYRFR